MPIPTGKVKLLFVDDEPMILRGLRSVFRKERDVWDMAFATSGAEALELLAAAPFDVIVTDMRMPEMDGAQLLAIVQERWPRTSRIVLSGQAERGALLRMLPMLHGFLSKPCSSQDLRVAISRCSGHLECPVLRAMIGKLDKLPSTVASHARIVAAAGKRHETLAAILEDSALALKILQIACSGAFGESQPAPSVAACAGYLGDALVEAIAADPALCAPDAGPPLPISIDHLQAHALRTAQLAGAFIQDRAGSELAYTCGLLHDIGRIVLQRSAPDAYTAMCDELKITGERLVIAERRCFGSDHAAIGGALMRLWGLPQPLVEAVEHHHEPEGASAEVADIIAVVHVAEKLADHADSTEIDPAFLRSPKLAAQLPRWRGIAQAASDASARSGIRT
ncbi:MAG: HDOD domain-containing protein [Kofleriaceae bacterium]